MIEISWSKEKGQKGFTTANARVKWTIVSDTMKRPELEKVLLREPLCIIASPYDEYEWIHCVSEIRVVS